MNLSVNLKRMLAREWIILVVFVLLGAPITVFLYFQELPEQRYSSFRGDHRQSTSVVRDVKKEIRISKFLDYLSNGDVETWCGLLLPYILFMFFRSLIWSIRILKR